MNCPSKTDPDVPPQWNQSPNALSGDLTTRSDLDNIASARLQHDHKVDLRFALETDLATSQNKTDDGRVPSLGGGGDGAVESSKMQSKGQIMLQETMGPSETLGSPSSSPSASVPPWKRWTGQTTAVVIKFFKFLGPGFIISVAYIDPGNYATDVAAGASYRFQLLFMILLSNIFAIFLQSLCVKLGSVTGLNLAEMCKAHFPPWLNYFLYFFAESAIIATDIAEVIGTAIALKLLLNIPLVAGCAISIVDVLFILLFYRPSGKNMKALRAFELFVTLLVLGVVICFSFQLSLIRNVGVGEVFRGYLPSAALVQSQGLYQACGILGATVMPHSLYLGSGIIQARLEHFDITNNNVTLSALSDDEDEAVVKYKPSIHAIRACMKYSVAELTVCLFTFALFVNSAILIVAGASLSGVGAEDADLFGIHDLLSQQLAPAAGTIFALALLLSGTSAGIVCTIAGQMVSEGQLSLKMKPWVRRLLTRSISITPSIIIAGAVGQSGLSAALQGSQVALSVILPFVTAPLIYFTCRNKFMTVPDESAENIDGSPNPGYRFRNNWFTALVAILIWLIIAIMNVALLVFLGLGRSG